MEASLMGFARDQQQWRKMPCDMDVTTEYKQATGWMTYSRCFRKRCFKSRSEGIKTLQSGGERNHLMQMPQ